MFFDNRDDLSMLMYEMQEEFEKSGHKKFAIRLLRSYDEVSFEIVKRYVPAFNRWIKESSGNQAEIITKRIYQSTSTSDRDIFTDSNEESVSYDYLCNVYLVWTGKLPTPVAGRARRQQSR